MKRVAVAALGAALLGAGGAAQAAAFTFIQAGYQAEVVGTSSSFLGGVAFAPDGDILADNCQGSGSPLTRWNVQGGTTLVNGSSLYSSSSLPSNAGCGLTTHSDGFVYSNTSSGVVKLDPNTGAQIGAASGGGGNALGIAEDPLTGYLYWVGSNQTIKVYDPVGHAIVNPAFANNGGFTDGIFWKPDGSLLYTTDRSAYTVDIFNRLGGLVSSIPIGHEPDGIAFAAAGFVLTNNTDGTITRINSDGTTALFASGGFRGDLAQVGPDGAWYITQAGTRYENGATSGLNSIVRISAIGGGGGGGGGGGFIGGGGHVPEPATLALLGLGCVALVAGRRRRLV